jgi:hypothetical protein
MPLWSDDLSKCSFDEVVHWRETNRQWSKEIRQASTALVNSRLTKQIDLEEYASRRSIGHINAMECQRRTAVILKEIWARENADVAISPILTGIGVLP